MSSKKSANRSHPYQNTTTRKSTRKPKNKQNEGVDLAQVDQNRSHDQSNGPELQEQSTMPNAQFHIPFSTSEQGVSRQEFSDMKRSMESMQNMLTGFMTNLSNLMSGSNGASTSSQADNWSSVQPNTVMTSQPVRVNQNLDINPNAEVSQREGVNPSFGRPIPVIHGAPIQESIPASVLQQQVMDIVNPSTTGKDFTPTPVCHNVDRKVPPNIMQDIWEEKYVNLEDLIDKADDSNEPLSMLPGKVGEPVYWGHAKSKKGINSLGQWANAFDIFIAVYTRKYPLEAPNLMTYAAKVKSLASKDGDYITYDKQFRLAREKHRLPWQNPDLELWVDCAQAGLRAKLNKVVSNKPTNNNSFRGSPSSSSSSSNKLQHPSGSCYIFHNRNGRCNRNNCKFSHQCYFSGCGEKHSIYSCPKYINSIGVSGGQPPVKSTSTKGTKPSTNSS